MLTIFAFALALAIASAPAVHLGAQERGEPRPRPPRQPATATPPNGPGGGGSVESSDAAYRSVLDTVAGGSTADAALALVAFERQVGAEPGSGAARAVERAEMDVLDAIARRNAEALLPAMVLHLHLFRIHSPRREYAAAGRHAALAERAAVLYARYGQDRATRRLSAEALTVLGAGLVTGGHRTDARRVLSAALDLSPVQPEALLVLAADRERDGAYGEAVTYLRRLNAVRPNWLEARVRLAVNLARTGAQAEAAERFGAMCRDPEAGWAAVLSCEELARMRLAAGEPGAAQALLSDAVERFPDAERLRLTLAYAVDRGGDPAAARALVEEVAERPAGGDESPRRRYNRGTDSDPILELSARLEAKAAERAPALAAVLAAMAAEEEGA
ncbi:MAG TPA: tetratricopeptide repeat protein [Thermoanaerobaculia bacterium]|nr:tetratricopeptide repeat protein [Thermoanaerobaculia bacterium]